MFGKGLWKFFLKVLVSSEAPNTIILPCPDDIYISPSQIRRFDLKQEIRFQAKSVRQKKGKSILPF